MACASKDVSKGKPLLFYCDKSLITMYMHFFETQPHRNGHEFEARWTASDKDL